MVWASMGKGKGNKYHAQAVERYGLRFASKLELFMYEGLQKFKIPFEFQQKIELQPSFTNSQGSKIRSVYMIVDFVINSGGETLYVDTKGFYPPLSLLKYKLLDYKMNNEKNKYRIVFLKNKREVNQFLIEMYNQKMKKNG